MFLDAEKAFDILNWVFMFKVLEDRDFGGKIFQGIKAVYTSQQAKIINRNLSK